VCEGISLEGRSAWGKERLVSTGTRRLKESGIALMTAKVRPGEGPPTGSFREAGGRVKLWRRSVPGGKTLVRKNKKGGTRPEK